jgi:peptidoglycan/LPS O-acetylase OafA/YrhL
VTSAFPRFYLRRALRLYPALLVMVLLVTPIAAVGHVGHPVPDGLAALFYVTDFWSNAFGHLTLLLHTWSLGVEEQFYLVWPVVLLFMLRRNLPLRVILIGLATVSVLITYAASTVSHAPSSSGGHPVPPDFTPGKTGGRHPAGGG